MKGEKCFDVFALETKATKLSLWQQSACGKLYLVQEQTRLYLTVEKVARVSLNVS